MNHDHDHDHDLKDYHPSEDAFQLLDGDRFVAGLCLIVLMAYILVGG